MLYTSSFLLRDDDDGDDDGSRDQIYLLRNLVLARALALLRSNCTHLPFPTLFFFLLWQKENARFIKNSNKFDAIRRLLGKVARKGRATNWPIMIRFPRERSGGGGLNWRLIFFGFLWFGTLLLTKHARRKRHPNSNQRGGPPKIVVW